VKTGKLKRVAGQLNIWSIDTEKAYVSDLQGAPYGGIHQQGASFTPRVGNMSGMSQAAKTAMRRGGRVKVNQSAGTRMVVGGTVGGGSNTIPARPFLLIQDEDVNEVEKVFLDWVRERAVAAGFRPGI
jgi:phage gpG-like protein